METTHKPSLIVSTKVKAPLEKVWRYWNETLHIVNWAFATEDWHAPYAENDLRVNGHFKTTMAAKDGSMSFDFEGIYTALAECELIAYSMPDERKVKTTFESKGDTTQITQIFEPDATHPADVQQAGWQAILDNFKKYVEAVE